MKYLQYVGVIIGAIYGLIIRLFIYLNDINLAITKNLYSIYSISFVWITPVIISIIPILFAPKEILDSRARQFFLPVLSVFVFIVFALSTGIEDWLCILILGFPYLLAAGIVGLVIAPIIKKRKSKKLYSIVLLPFILNPIESYIPNKIETFHTQTTIEINAKKEIVWNNLIEVPEIKEDEFDYGILNYLGVPRPVKSKLEVVDGQQYRIGYFTDNLKLYETISEVDTLNFVEFKIHMDKSKLRDLPTDNHILKSNNFHFNNISYRLQKTEVNSTKLSLNCDYTLNSKMNFYANFWANLIIKDFEERLLTSLKLKLEKQTNY